MTKIMMTKAKKVYIFLVNYSGNKSRPQTSTILSKIRNSQNNSEANEKYSFPKIDKVMDIQVLPSIPSFKTSSAKENKNSEPKYRKKTEIAIPAKCNQLN